VLTASLVQGGKLSSKQAYLFRQAGDGLRWGSLNRIRLAQEVSLEMEVVDGAESTERIIAEAEAWVVNFIRTLQCKNHCCLVNHLRDAVIDPRHQKHVAIFDRRDIDEDEVRGRAADARRVIPCVTHRPCSELEEDFLHGRLLEVELGCVIGLTDLVNAKLRRPLLGGSALVELSHKAVDAFSHLQTAGTCSGQVPVAQHLRGN
jgi:hypothetical protein